MICPWVASRVASQTRSALGAPPPLLASLEWRGGEREQPRSRGRRAWSRRSCGSGTCASSTPPRRHRPHSSLPPPLNTAPLSSRRGAPPPQLRDTARVARAADGRGRCRGVRAPARLWKERGNPPNLADPRALPSVRILGSRAESKGSNSHVPKVVKSEVDRQFRS